MEGYSEGDAGECSINEGHHEEPEEKHHQEEQDVRQRPTLQTEMPSCDVCGDLDWTQFGAAACKDATTEQLSSALQRGCSPCSLISNAISTFCSSLSSEHSKVYSSQRLHQIDILLGERIALCLRLHFHLLGGGSSTVLLDFFSPRTSCKWPVDKASDCLPTKLDLSGLAKKVTAWMENCDSKHIQCRISACPALPARVLDVGLSGSYNDIKLVLSHGNSGQYIALSYCWGKGDCMIKTTKSSIGSWTQSIPWQELPKTFQDAIDITRKLGIQYLWIDSLCIVQDDVQDWETESANMSKIYSNSYVTLAATAASDCHSGLFTDRWTRAEARNGFKLSVEAHQISPTIQGHDESIFVRPRVHLAHRRFRNMENAKEHAEDAPLLTRAWAFQERLLPSRTLHFHAEELVWECKSAVQCECGKLGRQVSFEKYGMKGWLKNFVTGSLYADQSAAKLGYVWLDLVSEFGALDLTHESDRLPALSGLAYEFSNKSLGAYIAGIWEHDLARSLLFEVVGLNETLTFGHNQLSGPSWSWASSYLAGARRISYGIVLKDGFIQDSSFRLIAVYLTPHSSNPFSWVEHGLLLVKGACSVARIVVEPPVLGERRERKFVLEVGGVQRTIPLEDFISDSNIEHLDNIPLCCLLVGSPEDSWEINTNYASCEYVLVLQKASADLNTYKRVGMLLSMDGSCSLRNEPVLSVLLA